MQMHRQRLLTLEDNGCSARIAYTCPGQLIQIEKEKGTTERMRRRISRDTLRGLEKLFIPKISTFHQDGKAKR